MTRYEYRCRRCGHTQMSSTRADLLGMCSRCESSPMRRVWSVRFGSVLHEHYNHSVGKPISSHRQYADELKRLSEQQTERTGIPHNYVPVDLSDTRACGVTDEGLEETARRRHDAGLH